MHRSSRVLALLSLLVVLACWGPPRTADAQSLASLAKPPALRSTEQEWIVSDVIARIAEIAGTNIGPVAVKQVPASGRDTAFALTIGTSATTSIAVVDHLWSPETFRPLAERLLRTAPASRPSHAASTVTFRDALTDLTVETLIEENEHLSMLLRTDRWSPDLHESAALLVGAFALREAAGILHDVRPALSRMTAHLAAAGALRSSGPTSRDGALARIVLAALAGRQREAMALIAAFQRQPLAEFDRRWMRALTLRATGDWRAPRPETESMLERLERARAIRERLGTDAYLEYFDTLPDDNLIDWQRLVFLGDFSVEAGNRFMRQNLQNELDESKWLWSQFHDGEPAMTTVLDALNARTARGAAGTTPLEILDWPLWAAHQQRHFVHALIAGAHYEGFWGNKNEPILAAYDAVFSGLTLYPAVLRWLAPDAAAHERALAAARALVETTPELVTPNVWTHFLAPFAKQPPPAFPLDTSWFDPVLPAGVAFDLDARLTGPGRRRSSPADAARWAHEAPYDLWALWAQAWSRGTPSFEAARAALGPLLEYDVKALDFLFIHTAMPYPARVEVATASCRLMAGTCARLGELLLLTDRVAEAAGAYERWAMETRDQVEVSNGITWLVRYHQLNGNPAVAERLARAAAETYSARGPEVLAEWLDREGRHDEAENVLRLVLEKFPHSSTTALGVQLIRHAARTSDAALHAQATELLRSVFPDGPERLVTDALPAPPSDGITFVTFGDRAATAGARPTDVIVGVDGWRVRTTEQYAVVTRFEHGDTMTLTIWRDGRYEDLRVRVPERWFGTRFKDH